jgi:hypothetical protein
MRNLLFTQWNLFRALRLILGVGAVIQAIMKVEIVLGIAGALVAGMALLNIGCCGSSGCSVPSNMRR